MSKAETKFNVALERKFNFGVVASRKLYRSAQPDAEFLEYLKKRYGIKSIASFRIKTDESEEEFCQKNGLRLIEVPIKSWRRWPEPDEFQDFFDLLENPGNYPVLIHCMYGKDRTSMITALYRLKYENWTLKEAVAEMKKWKASWYWQLFVQTSAYRIIKGFREKNTLLLYLKKFLNVVFAFEGLAYAIRHEKSIKIFLFFEAISLLFLFWAGIILGHNYSITVWGFIILLVLYGAVNAIEMINSAIERLVDLINPKFDYRIKIIKDLLAGATACVGIAAIVVWVISVLLIYFGFSGF